MELDLFAHWAFATFALISALVVQVFKASVWTKVRAESIDPRASAYWWGRKTLPLHPVIAGALAGLIPGMPYGPGVPDTIAAHVLYYAAAGLVSTWAFNVLKSLARRRGIELSVPEPPK